MKWLKRGQGRDEHLYYILRQDNLGQLILHWGAFATVFY